MAVKNISRNTLILLLLIAGMLGCTNTNKKQVDMKSAQQEEAAIRALEDRFVAAFNSGDIDAIMKNYVPDNSFVLFDIVPREEYIGANAYRKAWAEMFTHFQAHPKISIIDISIIVDGDVGFGYCFQHLTGTDIAGHPVDRIVRVTDGYRKINGNWLIAHEHISVPVDFKTGKLVPLTKPVRTK